MLRRIFGGNSSKDAKDNESKKASFYRKAELALMSPGKIAAMLSPSRPFALVRESEAIQDEVLSGLASPSSDEGEVVSWFGSGIWKKLGLDPETMIRKDSQALSNKEAKELLLSPSHSHAPAERPASPSLSLNPPSQASPISPGGPGRASMFTFDAARPLKKDRPRRHSEPPLSISASPEERPVLRNYDGQEMQLTLPEHLRRKFR